LYKTAERALSKTAEGALSKMAERALNKVADGVLYKTAAFGAPLGESGRSLRDPGTSAAQHRKRPAVGFLVAVRIGFLLAKLLPAGFFIKGAALCGRLAGRISPARSAVAGNLRLIASAARRPGPRGAVKATQKRFEPADVFASYGRYWGELLAVAAHPELCSRLDIRVEGEECLRTSVAQGSVCLLTGHLGNWDLAAWWAATRLPGLAVVAEPLEPPALFRFFSRLRERWGCRVLSAEGMGLRLFRHLRGGGHVAMVVDRPFGSGCRQAPFLGRPRQFPSAGMDLARRAGARLVPGFLVREGAGYIIRIYPPLCGNDDPASAFARVLEREIQQQPEQWCVLSPIHEPEGSSMRGETR